MLVFSQLTFAQGRLLFIWQVSDDYCSLNQLSQHYVKSQLELLTSGIFLYLTKYIIPNEFQDLHFFEQVSVCYDL